MIVSQMASVIYLTDTRYGQRAWQHPSARHRCYHYADALLSQGGNAVVLPLERVNRAALKGFDHAVFHRPVWSRRFKHAIDCCQASGLRLHADYDDLIFHPDYAEFSPQHINGGKSIAKVQHQYKKTFAAAQCFDKFLLSTGYLSEKIRDIFPSAEITVLPNTLPRTFRHSDLCGRPTRKPTIGYFPGSLGHGEDLKSISGVLNEILDTGVRFLIVGRLNKQVYKDLPNTKHCAFAEYTDYLKLLSLVDVSIAPLLNNEFNQSKSAVKLIESVAVGTPIVASMNQDMNDHDNKLSWLVSDEQQWKTALQEILFEPPSLANKDSVVRELQERFSVTNRLSILQEHLQCAA